MEDAVYLGFITFIMRPVRNMFPKKWEVSGDFSKRKSSDVASMRHLSDSWWWD